MPACWAPCPERRATSRPPAAESAATGCGVATAAAGIIVATVTKTPIGTELAGLVEQLSGGVLFIMLILVGLVALTMLVVVPTVLALFPLFAIVTVAGLYEVIEWQYAISADPDAGHAMLGSQGDPWDAQKDILADTLGALFALLLFFVINRDEVHRVIK